MLRCFGLAALFAASAEFFGVVVNVEAPAVEPAVVEPLAGVDVVGAAGGSVVNGVGSGGNGFEVTLAIRSVRPTSDWL